jgi:hypothetical protein
MVTHLLAAVMAAGLAVGAESASAGRASLEDAARDYRIEVYDTFRLDRPEFDRRRAEWRQLEQSWEAAGKSDRDVPTLLDWLAEATAQSQTDSIGPLPEAPKIVAEVKLPSVGRVAKPVTTEKPATTDAKPSPDAAENEPDTTPSATPVSSRNTLDTPALEEKKPDETAPVSTPIVPDPEAKDDAAKRPTAPAGAAAWFHDLGQGLGEDLNSLGLTLAWKREAKP